MSSFPAITVTSLHVCPLSTGPVPHVGGPVTGPGAVGVFHNNKPAAVVGDLCTCAAGPPAVIVQGQPGVMHGGVPAVAQNCLTSHGGTFATGEPNVLHGPVTELQKPYRRYRREVAAQTSVAVAAPASATAAMRQVEKRGALTRVPGREEAPGSEWAGLPRIFNMQWVSEKRVVRNGELYKEVTIRGQVHNIEEGQSVTLTIKAPNIEGREADGEQEIVQLTGTVKDRRVEVVWEIMETPGGNSFV